MNALYTVGLGEFPGESVFAAAIADNEDAECL